MKDKFNVLTSSVSWILTAVQTNEILQTIMFIMSIISTAFTIAYTIHKWYNKAKEDGKITKEELQELGENLTEVLKQNEEDKK